MSKMAQERKAEGKRRMENIDKRIVPGAKVSLKNVWPSDGYTVVDLSDTGVIVKRGSSSFGVLPENIVIE